jgi:large subunit ribosomal protein L6
MKNNLIFKVPSSVKISSGVNSIKFKGKNGNLKINRNYPGIILSTKKDSIFLNKNKFPTQLILKKRKFLRSIKGTIVSTIKNSIIGVTEGYKKKLKISGVGFYAKKVQLNNKKYILEMNLGYSHKIKYKIPKDILILIPEKNIIHVIGNNKIKVGIVSADIKRFYPVEPYKGKGIHIVGEFIRRKQGKKTS